ncbi:XRE family transcriptional regulator [Embleya sp. NPDC005971]|uniref:XRE family transcriptional regulator n=1 Tax=Embleya sp. NPDC005971 TaxID=3156724 RepID=UPI0033E5CC6A
MTRRDDSAPRPDTATTAAEYVAALRELREWSALTYRQLAAKAEASGHVLPASTVAAALGRSTLPRADLVEALVFACGLDTDAAARWLTIREDLAAGRVSERPAPEPAEVPDTAPAPPPGRRRRPGTMAIAIGMACLLIAIGVILAVRYGTDDGDGDDSAAFPSRPRDGFYLIKPTHIADGSLCLGEGRERNLRTDRPIAVQRSCEGVVPDTYLVAVAPDVYLIKWRHPVEGVGCLRVDEAILVPGALLSPGDCTGAANERFLIEPVDPGVFRLRPVHSGLCIGILGGPAEVTPKAEAAQAICSGAADQRFRLQTVKGKKPLPAGQ